jgi:hypothetical protein
MIDENIHSLTRYFLRDINGNIVGHVMCAD